MCFSDVLLGGAAGVVRSFSPAIQPRGSLTGGVTGEVLVASGHDICLCLGFVYLSRVYTSMSCDSHLLLVLLALVGVYP